MKRLLIPSPQEQPLIRLPYELSRKNFKSIQVAVEHERKHILAALKATANASFTGAQAAPETIAAIDAMIARLKGLKRKMELVQAEENKIQASSRRRLEHLNDLYGIPSLADVKYEEWSWVRLNRLLVDYLLRMGYVESARTLAQEKGIEELVDIDVFVQCHRVEASLKRGSAAEALVWCREHQALMKKAGGALEFELRLQQFIEQRREGKLAEAKRHAQKYLAPYIDTYPNEFYQAMGLLAYPPNTRAEKYKVRSILQKVDC